MPANKISEVLQSRERWGRRVVTLLLFGVLGALGFYYWGQIVPFVLDVVTDTLRLAVACVALVFLGYMVLDPRMRTLWLYSYRSMVRWLTTQFIDIDPIGILQTYVSRLKDKLAEMEQAIGSLQGQHDQLAALIAKNEEERMHELQRARNAKKLVEQGGGNAAEMRGQLALSGRQAGRLEASNKTLSKLLQRMDHLLTALKKLRDTSRVVGQDIEAEVKVKTEEHKMITRGYGAFKKAQRVMAPGGTEKELYDDTLDKLADSYSEKMGQIEYFMEVSRSVINGADLDNMAYEDSALAQLEKWERNASVPKTRVEALGGVRVGEEVEPPPDSFSSLFQEKQRKS